MENPREIIDDKYQAFIDNGSIHMNYTKFEYVYKSYIGLLDKVDAVSMLMKERQFLTELHLMGPLFPLTAHEKYHDVSDKLQIEASDFFKDSKIFLNDFTRFYIGEIGKDDKRGITPKSFGSCLHSVIKNISSLPEHATFLYKPFIRYGRQIDASVCDYRDKFIEHSDSLSTPMLNTGPCSLRLVHMESNAFGRPRSTEEQLKANNLFLTSQDMFLLRTEHGTHCYVHVSPYYTTGADVFSGDEIGGIYDGTKLHFKKYGAHTHYFPPLNDDLENEFSMPVHIHQIGESPDILHSIDLITIFTFTALDSLMTYKTNQ